MIVLSLNIRGLGSPSKRLVLARLVELHKIDVILVRFGSSEVLLHRRRPTRGSDRALFLPSDFIMCFS